MCSLLCGSQITRKGVVKIGPVFLKSHAQLSNAYRYQDTFGHRFEEMTDTP